jgi:hypothetical protein
MHLKLENDYNTAVACAAAAAAAGLFLGTFGPHGPEVLSLSRSISLDNGEEELLGLKLTGDPNVPAGEVGHDLSVWGNAVGPHGAACACVRQMQCG